MKTLCMDSAHKYLVLALYEDDKLIGGTSILSWKRQSEAIFPELIKLMDEAKWVSEDINEIVISDGPGSYTGVRIAMSIAKVFCTTMNIPLYTISTLQLYAGVHEDVFVMMDARSSRAYTGLIHAGEFVEEPSIKTLDEINEIQMKHHYKIIGDCDLIGEAVVEPKFLMNFMDLRPFWHKVENIHTLVPAYMKEQDAYRV